MKWQAVNICFKLKSRKNAAAPEKFVSMTRHVHQYDRTLLYTESVEAHRNNVDKLTEVFMKMQEEGVAPLSKVGEIITNAFGQGQSICRPRQGLIGAIYVILILDNLLCF